MSKRESIARYTLIIQMLRKHPATFAEIEDYLALESDLEGFNYNISKRTFQRDLEDIRSLYNIYIQFDFSRKVYYIDFENQPEATERILEAFDTFNALNLSDRLSNNIHFEKRRPQGTENIYGLLHAIKNQYQIKFSYQKFWEDHLSLRNVEPYALKEFKNRWYVLAKDLKDKQVKSFALDRLSDLDISKKRFQLPNDFNVNDHYKYCFGIISPNDNPLEEVILSFTEEQGKYIKTLPLHHTQEIMNDTKKEFRIKLQLYITHDFKMELLSYGDQVMVIAPKSLAEDIKKTLRDALGRYK